MQSLFPVHLTEAADAATRALSSALDRDWGVNAGDLEWTCRRTLDHIPDALLLYANHLSTRATERRPHLRNGDPAASPEELLDVLDASASVLADVIRAAPADTRAFHPAGRGDLEGFVAMGCDEILVHCNDIALGLGVRFDPPRDLCRRVLVRLFPWAPSDLAPWEALLWSNGRYETGAHERLDPNWWWHPAPLSEWDGTVKRRTVPPAW